MARRGGAIAFFVILGTIGLNLTPLLAGATVIGATLGFGAQSMVRDLLAGVLLTVEGQFDIGDTIAVGDTTGTVEDLTLRVTRLRSDDGTVWYVPNGEIRKLANSSRGWAQATVDVPVPAPRRASTPCSTPSRPPPTRCRNDPRYVALCLEPPRLWGVVATAADTFTCRVSVRTSTTDRERVARILRQEIALRLQAAGAFAVTAVALAPADPAGPARSADPTTADGAPMAAEPGPGTGSGRARTVDGGRPPRRCGASPTS